jgi:8-hydroxy-5-deazaflavin:NADPH oxidoreductase
MAEFTYDAAPRPRTPVLDGLITAILGGTGEQGRGLARRLAMAGHPVIIGSRSRNRARATAQEVGHGICGLANRDANLVIVAVPYQGHGELLAGLAAELAGKIVVDCVNPLGFDEGGAYPLPVPEGSPLSRPRPCCPAARWWQRSTMCRPSCCLTPRRRP